LKARSLAWYSGGRARERGGGEGGSRDLLPRAVVLADNVQEDDDRNEDQAADQHRLGATTQPDDAFDPRIVGHRSLRARRSGRHVGGGGLSRVLEQRSERARSKQASEHVHLQARRVLLVAELDDADSRATSRTTSNSGRASLGPGSHASSEWFERAMRRKQEQRQRHRHGNSSSTSGGSGLFVRSRTWCCEQGCQQKRPWQGCHRAGRSWMPGWSTASPTAAHTHKRESELPIVRNSLSARRPPAKLSITTISISRSTSYRLARTIV